MEISSLHKPPYYAVIFTSIRTDVENEYDDTANRMVELAESQPGFLGIDSVREGVGITVSYWESEKAIREWQTQIEHVSAQNRGYSEWYQSFTMRICKVEREYDFIKK